MPRLPSLRAAIIAEYVRREGEGKLSILGFFGVGPSITIGLPSIPGDIPSLSILLSCDVVREGGTPDLHLTLIDPSGVSLVNDIQVQEVPPLEVGRNGAIIVGFQQLPVLRAGVYQFQLFDAGDPYTTLNVNIVRSTDIYQPVQSVEAK